MPYLIHCNPSLYYPRAVIAVLAELAGKRTRRVSDEQSETGQQKFPLRLSKYLNSFPVAVGVKASVVDRAKSARANK